MQDIEIIALFEARNELAISAVASQYGKYCTRIATNILTLSEDSEECVNDTYHTLWNRIPPDKPQIFRHYLGVLVRNLALTRYRANHAQKRYQGMEIMLSELSTCIPDHNRPEDAVDAKELTRHIEAWLKSLRKEDRHLFLRRYWYGDSVKELAQQTMRSENAISLRLFKLRSKLKTALQEKGVSI